MLTNTKVLFCAVLKALQAECVCDIGSRDGVQALLFRHLLPKARVFAFEANPFNFRAMQKNAVLTSSDIELIPCAVGDHNGTEVFHITDVDYDDPNENRGTSSLLHHRGGLKVKESVSVEIWRIDDFLLERCPAARKIGLWIDVEGAEALVLDGMEKIRDRVIAIHVETARTAVWEGQKTLSDLTATMAEKGYLLCGSNFPKEVRAGDVVFVSREAASALGKRLLLGRMKAYLSYWLQADNLAVYLKTRSPWLYRTLRRLLIRFGT